VELERDGEEACRNCLEGGAMLLGHSVGFIFTIGRHKDLKLFFGVSKVI